MCPFSRCREKGHTSRAADRLLVGDGGAGGLESLLSLVRSLLVDLLQNGLGGSLDQILGFLQTKAGERPHLLDHLDLLVAGCLEDDIDLVAALFLDGTGLAAGCCRRRSGGNGGGRCYAEGGLEFLDELAELDQGQLLEGIKEISSAELRHSGRPS